MADPLDKQLVEAVLTRPRRGKADVEAAKLANLRPGRSTRPATGPEELDEDDEDGDLPLAPDGELAAEGADVGSR